MINASMIESNLINFNLGLYQGRRDFDSKGFATKVLGLKGQSPIVPCLEDLWEDCNNEREVVKRDHSRLTLPQINSLKFKFKLEAIVEDGLDVVEPGWEEANEQKQLEVDWNRAKEDDVNLRTRSILSYTNN